MIRWLATALLLTTSVCASDIPNIATFSIVARDPNTGEIGVAVQSKFVAVGGVVPYAKAGVGAIATQALANPNFGPIGLELLAAGKSTEEISSFFQQADPGIANRQFAILPTEGEIITFTGDKCLEWAGSQTGKHYAVQGNILANENVITAMAEAFEQTEGALAERLIAALKAGQDAGGDKRGRQSAALLVVRQGWGYAGANDRFRDLRVDDDERPIEKLKEIYQKHREIFPRPKLKKEAE
ncbi:MAG: DUF1028 domain-containing protein [Verrucomicrobiota bacterium]